VARLHEYQGKKFLPQRIQGPTWSGCIHRDEAVAAAKELGSEVVIKIQHGPRTRRDRGVAFRRKTRGVRVHTSECWR